MKTKKTKTETVVPATKKSFSGIKKSFEIIAASAKSVWAFVCRWADALVFLPIALVLFLTADMWIGFIDPTAPVMSAEFLSILLFNLLTWLVIMVGSYTVTRIMFQFDIFEKGWQEKYFYDRPWLGAVVSALLWVVVLIVTCLLLIRNL